MVVVVDMVVDMEIKVEAAVGVAVVVEVDMVVGVAEEDLRVLSLALLIRLVPQALPRSLPQCKMVRPVLLVSMSTDYVDFFSTWNALNVAHTKVVSVQLLSKGPTTENCRSDHSRSSLMHMKLRCQKNLSDTMTVCCPLDDFSINV